MLKTIIAAAILAVLFVVGYSTQSYSANITLEDNTVTIEGDIEDTDFSDFINIANNKKIDLVVLKNSNGGFFKPAVNIGLYINFHEIDTITNGFCHSACTYIWLSGEHRILHENDMISIHMPGQDIDVTEEEKENSWKKIVTLVVWYLGKVTDLSFTTTQILTSIRNDSVLVLEPQTLDNLGIVSFLLLNEIEE